MIKPRDIWRSALKRFLPAVGAVLGIAFMATGLPPLGLPQLLLLSGEVLGLTVGFGLTLRLGRRFIRSRKTLLGKRAVLSGALAVPTLGFVLALFEGTFTSLPTVTLAATGVATLTGAWVGATMFLRRRKGPDPSLPRDEREALPSGESLEDWFERQEREADRIYRDDPRAAA